jgi:hypothetical protein
MDFEPRYTQEQEDFRQEVRHWLRENVLPGIDHPADSADLTYEQYQLRREWGWKLAIRVGCGRAPPESTAAAD